MKMMNINLDQLIKELENTTISDLDDEALCALGLKLRMAVIVMSQHKNLTAEQQQTMDVIRQFDDFVAGAMFARGYRVVDSDELVEANPEDLVEALVDMDFSALIEWADVLKETAAENEKDAEILNYVNSEIMRRSMEMSGGVIN